LRTSREPAPYACSPEGSRTRRRYPSNKCERAGAPAVNSQGTKRLFAHEVNRAVHAHSFIYRDVVMRAGNGVQFHACPRARLPGSGVRPAISDCRPASLFVRCSAVMRARQVSDARTSQWLLLINDPAPAHPAWSLRRDVLKRLPVSRPRFHIGHCALELC